MGTMPNVWNDAKATPALKSQLLWQIRRSMGLGISHIINALHTPDGVEVS